MQSVASLEVQAMVDTARKFLARYGVDDRRYTDDEILEKYQKFSEIKPSTVEVLSRGEAIDMMQALLDYIPKGYIGEFKPDRPLEQARARAIGWQPFVHEEASKLSPTGSSDNIVRIADEVLMFMPEEKYVSLRIRDDLSIQHNRDRRNPKKEAEAEEEKTQMQKIFEVGDNKRKHRRGGIK